MNGKKWIAGALAASVLAAALAGCGGAPKNDNQNQGGGTAAPTGGKEILVWSHLTQPEVDELNKIAQEWATKTGNKVTVQADQTGFQEFAAAATAGAAADIMYGLPHDNLGTFQKAGLLDPVPAGIINDADYEKLTIDGVSFDGKKYAVPISYEAVALFYNKALTPNAPKTWDEFMTVAKDKGFKYDIKNFYFSYGFLAANGGYVFKDKGNGALDPKDVGLASEGGKKGFQMLSDFVNTHKFMPSDVTGDMAKADFQAGKQAYYLSGPWDVQGFKDAKVDFGIAPIPAVPGGKPFAPFVGVQSAFVNSGSKVKTEAWDLIKYFQEKAPEVVLKVGNRIPAQKKYAETIKADPYLSGFSASALNGAPMPNIPAMQAVWTPAGDAINLVVSGQSPADQAATNAVKAINESVAAQQ